MTMDSRSDLSSDYICQFRHMLCIIFGIIGVVMFSGCVGASVDRNVGDAGTTASNLVKDGKTKDTRSGQLRSLTAGWKTDWTQHLMSYDELQWSGAKRDELPAIDKPHFIPHSEASSWLMDNEPVIVVDLEGEVRAYPLQIMILHEIVNDTMGSIPIVVTFCPLCNSSIVFDRRVAGTVYEFGTSGLLRNSDLVMYDRTHESLWQQFTGEGIVGEATGQHLDFLPSSLVGFGDFRKSYPDGRVLSRKTGFNKKYGRNPFAYYDTVGNKPFLFSGKTDSRLQAMERVVSVSFDTVEIAYPLTVLAEQGVVNDTRAGRHIAIFYGQGTSSALDSSQISKGRDVGSTGVFDAVVDGKILTFRRDGTDLTDEETKTRWNIFGQGVEGALKGKQLVPIVHGNHFWFSWAAFKPKTIVYQ